MKTPFQLLDFSELSTDSLIFLIPKIWLATIFKAPLSSGNIKSVSEQLELDFQYIRSLRCPSSGKPITSTNRKTGFIGFLIAIFNIKRLFDRLNIDFLCTYKISQDHLELFFSKIRSHCGHNNNPTALQFESSYKRLLIHNELKEIKTGNCTPLVEMSILTVSSVTQKKSDALSKQLIQQINRETSRLLTEEPVDFEIDEECETYLTSNFRNHHTFYSNVVAYMAGYVARKLRKSLNCEVCVSALTEDDSLIARNDWLHFIRFKDNGGLLYPSPDVVKICIQCEKQFKANVHANLSQVKVLRLVNLTALSFVGENLFPSVTNHVLQQSPLESHSSILLRLIAAVYFEIRIAYAARMCNINSVSKHNTSRQVSNKLILFSGL